MRPFAVPTLLVVLAVLAAVAVATAEPQGAKPRTAADRRAQIDALGKHLDALRKEADVDARAALVRTYQRYTSDRLANRADRVTVEMILDVVEDLTAPAEAREEAAKAVVWDQAQRYDPDLDAAGKGWARPRAKFSKKVLQLLSDKDPMTRVFAHNILSALWPGVRDPDITACNPRLKPSCTAAKVAWEKQLGK